MAVRGWARNQATTSLVQWGAMTAQPIRELTADERDVLDAMIRFAPAFVSEDDEPPVTDEDRERWLATMSSLRVVDSCDCTQCPSIELRHTDIEHTTDDESDDELRTILQAGGPQCLILLHFERDVPEYLELAPIDDELVFTEFPAPREIDFTDFAAVMDDDTDN